jgi:hypothetical protein
MHRSPIELINALFKDGHILYGEIDLFCLGSAADRIALLGSLLLRCARGEDTPQSFCVITPPQEQRLDKPLSSSASSPNRLASPLSSVPC